MMIGVAEPNESQNTSRNTGETARADSARQPDVIDADIVEETSSTGDTGGQPREEPSATGPRDAEEHRQYQQFLEFQKFQEWQRQHGGGTAPGPAPKAPERRGRRWWYYAGKLLSFKPVRRLLYLVIAALLVLWAINSTFSSGDDSSSHGGVPGNQDPGTSPMAAGQPHDAVVNLYNLIANDPDPTAACDVFTQQGKVAFAGANGAPDCPAAVQRIKAQITNPSNYANPGYGPDAIKQVNDQAIIDSCRAGIDGGPRLGKFRLARQYNGGWLIDRYAGPTC